MGINLCTVQSLYQAAEFLNENQGVVTISVFFLTILLGWLSGVFKSLRRKSELKFETIQVWHFCVRLAQAVSIRIMIHIAPVLHCI